MTCYQSIQKRKSYYIPMCSSGQLSIRRCAQILNLAPVNVWKLKKKYEALGPAAFVNGHKGKSYQTKKYPDSLRCRVVSIYREFWPDSPFATFRDSLASYHDLDLPYNAVRLILLEAGIKPPRSWSTKEKEEHRPRDERASSGELVQMDASTHDWFMDGRYETLHGGIDDATHSVTGLYFCRNECRLGYNEVLRQTWRDFGLPRSYYIDRHSSFVKSGRKSRPLTERLELSKNEQTHFVDLCSKLSIEIILALSPQGKGRIERLWQTLQGRLPFIFRFLGIHSIDAANAFLVDFRRDFLSRFVRTPASPVSSWRPLPSGFDEDYELALKFSARTDSSGYFSFHDCDFRLVAPNRAYRKFELCLSEAFGIRARIDGRWYDVELAQSYLQDVYSDRMPAVEKDLIARYLLSDLRALA